MKSSKALGSGSWIRRQRFFGWLWVIGRSGAAGQRRASRERSAEVDERPVSVTAATVEQPTGQQPDGDKELRWQVSTSGMARKGLGWPVDDAGDDGVLISGLGWPGSTFGSVPKLIQLSITDSALGSVHGSLPEGADTLVPGSAPGLVPEPAPRPATEFIPERPLGSGPGGAEALVHGGAQTLVPGSAQALVPEPALRPATEFVPEPILGAVPESVLRPKAQSVT